MTSATSSSISPADAISDLLARLPKPARLLIAVSGGSDSLGLLLSLAHRPCEGVTLFAVTVDHRLRSESAAEACEVARICHDLGVTHIIKNWLGAKPKSGIAAAAREARYQLLCEAAGAFDATAILTGHTLDDQIETVTMRAERSCDPSAPGLSGMSQAVLLHRRYWLLRPFLWTRRQEIRQALERCGQNWIDDPSNVDVRSERARTRLALGGAASVSPTHIAQVATRRAVISDDAAKWIDEYVKVTRAALMHVAPGGLDIDPAVLRYGLSSAIAVLGGREQGPAASMMQRIVAECRRFGYWRMTAGRVALDRRQRGLYLCREVRSLPLLMLGPGESATWDGRFRISNSGREQFAVTASSVERERAMELFTEIPPTVALRAGQTRPSSCLESANRTGFQCRPLLAPFERFLPQFDYNLASRLAESFGCDNFPPLPFNNSVRKR